MTKEEIFKRTIEAWLTKDLALFLSLLTEDISYTECYGAEYQGKSECEQWFRDWCGPKENQVRSWTVNASYFSGNVGFFLWTFEYQHNGKTGIFDGISVVEFRGDKISKLQEFEQKFEKFRPYTLAMMKQGEKMTQKIIFMGTPDFSATVLKGLIDSGEYEILAVVTQPDRKVGRKQVLHETPVKQLAKSQGLLILQPEKLSGSEEMAQLIEFGAAGAGIVTAAFGQFLPGKLLDAVQFAVNVHASLLPKYRGGAPIHYALMSDDKEIGVTLMEMVRKMDAGDMIAQKAISVTDEDNVGTMFEKLALVGRDLLLENLPKYLAGEIKPQAQNESQVSFSPNISPEEERIDWTHSAREIFNQIRGMNPFPVAHTLWNGERFKIYEAQVVDGTGAAGEIIGKTKKSLIVACGEKALELKVVQPAGKPKMEIVSFLNGLGQKMQLGDKLGG